MMPEMDGIQLLRRLWSSIQPGRHHHDGARGTISTAVEAMKVGAFDYILKPFKLQRSCRYCTRGMEVRRLRLENVRLRQYVELTFKSPACTSSATARP
jgi:DNA-binding NtrC family response regulator